MPLSGPECVLSNGMISLTSTFCVCVLGLEGGVEGQKENAKKKNNIKNP